MELILLILLNPSVQSIMKCILCYNPILIKIRSNLTALDSGDVKRCTEYSCVDALESRKQWSCWINCDAAAIVGIDDHSSLILCALVPGKIHSYSNSIHSYAHNIAVLTKHKND